MGCKIYYLTRKDISLFFSPGTMRGKEESKEGGNVNNHNVRVKCSIHVVLVPHVMNEYPLILQI